MMRVPRVNGVLLDERVAKRGGHRVEAGGKTSVKRIGCAGAQVNRD